MKSPQFRKWLYKTYGKKQPREQFVADFNAIAQAVGEPPITWAAVNHWMHDRPLPEKVGALTFERVLELIEERRANPKAATRIYTVTLPVDSDTERAIEKRAFINGVEPEELLRSALEATLAKLPK